MNSRDSNIQPFDLQSDALPLRHEVLTEIGSKKIKKTIRILEGQGTFMSKADVLQEACESN